MNYVLTVFDGESSPQKIELSDERERLSFGRNATNDVVIQSAIVSNFHGYIQREEDQFYIVDLDSTNGTYVNGSKISKYRLNVGDIIKIDNIKNPLAKGVTIIFEEVQSDLEWNEYWWEGKDEVTIGRSDTNDIVLKHILVSGKHAEIRRRGKRYYLIDYHSFSGISVNNRPVRGKALLEEKDCIVIANTKLIFSSKRISYYETKKGMDLDALHITRTVKTKDGPLAISNDISVHIKAGEFVSILGGSGAGKTTFMNGISGYHKATSGRVFVNGLDLYEGYELLKNLIGYVPQQDIVYDKLTLYNMLDYVAKLKIPPDITEEERRMYIQNTLRMVELDGKEDTFIDSLSGGQKKRASIAVELLADPNLFFLDEPTSGLDPGTETHMMQMLRRLSDAGKTVIMVTHNITNIDLCDRIIMLGKGGNLCFSGSPQKARSFFEVQNIQQVYDLVTDNTDFWKQKFENSEYGEEQQQIISSAGIHQGNLRKSVLAQTRVLCSRYFHIVWNDRQRLFMLLLQAPLLAVLIYLVANGKQFEEYEVTKSLLFALSCCAFWIGILNSIQEICKEKNIYRREHMTGVHIRSYLFSKYFVLMGLCMIQTILLITTFGILVGIPEEGVIFSAYLDLGITTYLTAVSASSMGLFVSCLFQNPDRAMTAAPILLLPQILFSGLVFDLDGMKEKISVFVNCRWSMEGYGTIANLNSLKLKMQNEIPQLEHEAENMFEHTREHLLLSWGMLIAFTILFFILCILKLNREEGEK